MIRAWNAPICQRKLVKTAPRTGSCDTYLVTPLPRKWSSETGNTKSDKIRHYLRALLGKETFAQHVILINVGLPVA